MLACATQCTSDCVEYKTPLNQCYSTSALFQNDPQWGSVDMYDHYSEPKHAIIRTMYSSTNKTCQNITDTFTIPLGVNVGPLGEPRPCGSFRLD